MKKAGIPFEVLEAISCRIFEGQSWHPVQDTMRHPIWDEGNASHMRYCILYKMLFA